MPIFNAAQTLGRAVGSVCRQNLQDWELLLIDDGSEDGSDLRAAELAHSDPRIRVIRLVHNKGAAVARNAGIAAAKGRYIAFLDADDTWMPEKLERQVALMQARQAVLSYTGFERDLNGTRRKVDVPPTVTRAQLLKGNVIACSTAIYDRAYYGDIQMPLLRRRQDFATWLMLLESTPLAHGVTQPLAVHYTHPDSLSAPRLASQRATWEMYRDHLGLSAVHSAWYMGNHLLRRLRRG